ncbi:SdiA-regulated domain-containing protein [Pseudomonas sp. nanlin1]|uniref:SdiA-regulated domain-containing protein n=1 Tax=Pseudomonas sp. nanlin1 TaxID=3040605 RepID=UPI00388D7252
MAPSESLSPALVPKRSRFALRWYSWLFLAAALSYALAVLMHWDDRGVLWVVERFQTPAERAQSVWLPSYQVVIDAKPLPGMEKDEASDITYNARTGTLFAVMGKNPFLVELTLQGDVLRKLPLVGWSNPEAITALDDGRLAIVDERRHLLALVSVTAQTQALNLADYPQFDLGPSVEQNKAFEAVAWDPLRKQLLLGEERPVALFNLKMDSAGQVVGLKHRVPSGALDMRNLSALAFDPRTNHRLALSADSHLLLEINEAGEQVSFMTLLGGFNGLKDTIPRAEGVAMDDAGTLYVVSEPNLFYAFKKK